MFECHVCGSKNAKKKLVKEVFTVNNKPVLVEDIPALVCERCGEVIFSRETTEKVRKMVHGEAKPVRSISLDVFEYA